MPSLGRDGRRLARRTLLLLGLVLPAACASPAHEVVARPGTGSPGEAAEITKLAALPVELFTAGAFSGSNGTRLAYRLLAPESPRAGRRYPLVLVLHGSGAIGTDNQAQLGPFARSWTSPGMRRRFPAYVLVPQFPARSAVYQTSGVDALPISRPQPSLEAALELVDKLLDGYPIDRGRVYAIGFSMGGSAVWDALTLRPELFAAAVPIAGVPPPRDEAPRIAQIPILIVHGTRDTENPIDLDRAMHAALRSAGARRVRFREYEGLDHNVPPDMILGTWWREWLFAQQRSEPLV
ncbi:MAG TPA: dienelactone hydrolase family protein [Thermoanaerobaculia bacterium]|nr:dienelactone hydrolase family protein [Thermoanaerobaculia bacterium]